jgi:hypothetical protein
MQVYQGAKKLGITNDEMIERIGDENVAHRMSKIPEGKLPELGLVPEDLEEPRPDDGGNKMEAPVLPAGVTAEKVWLSIRMLAQKSPYWEYRDLAVPPKRYIKRMKKT